MKKAIIDMNDVIYLFISIHIHIFSKIVEASIFVKETLHTMIDNSSIFFVSSSKPMS